LTAPHPDLRYFKMAVVTIRRSASRKERLFAEDLADFVSHRDACGVFRHGSSDPSPVEGKFLVPMDGDRDDTLCRVSYPRDQFVKAPLGTPCRFYPLESPPISGLNPVVRAFKPKASRKTRQSIANFTWGSHRGGSALGFQLVTGISDPAADGALSGRLIGSPDEDTAESFPCPRSGPVSVGMVQSVIRALGKYIDAIGPASCGYVLDDGNRGSSA
jgi:hypothetical protein